MTRRHEHTPRVHATVSRDEARDIIDNQLVVSVIVPAHNEAAVIGRLLDRLSMPTAPGSRSLEIVVVCNGCTDMTADVARRHANVTVIETPVPSKAAALRLGDEHAHGFPRLYVDADVELDADGVAALAEACTDQTILAAAPRRVLPRVGMRRLVRWYYDVWECLPAVEKGLFGRGVIAVSDRGHERIASLPTVMADDLAISAAFEPHERRIVNSATVIVHGPRTWADLIRRRVRAATGTHQVYAGDTPEATLGETVTPPRVDSRTKRADLVQMVRNHPTLLPKIPVFVAVALLAQRRAAKNIASGDFATWLRDESSRTTT